MKIAFIPSTYFPFIGGAEVQTHNLANKLIELGVEVDLIHLEKKINVKYNYNFFNLNKILVNIIYIFHYYFSIDIRFLLIPFFKNLIKKRKYHCWHFHSLNYKTLLYISILKKLGQKIYVTFQGADIQIKKNINYGYRLDIKFDLLLKKNLIYIDKFLSISKEIDKELEKLKVPNKKILYFPNSVEVSKFNKIKKNKFNKDELILITVARNSEKKKGYDLITKVYPLLDKKIKFKWYIIGKNSKKLLDKKNFNNFKNLYILDEIKNDNELYFPHSNLIKLYKNSDLYLNLSRIESFGITFIEAMSANIPIISFRTPGGRILIKNKQNGILVKNGDFKNYVKSIIQFKKNKAMNFTFNKKYLKKFDLKRNASTLINYYKK